MRSQRRNGFSLLELTIGFAIFMGIGIAFIFFLRNAISNSQFSGEHLTGVILAQKVSEDINEELNVNPYGLETLGIANSASNRLEVVDGKSIFFSFLDDKTAPWGKIEPTRDGFISPAMKPLYEIVQRFSFTVDAQRLQKSGSGENRNLLSCNLKFKWDTKTGKGTYDNVCLFFSPITEKKTDLSLIVNESAIDARIPKEVFNRPGKSILEIATLTGEKPEAITSLGRIALITQDFMKSDVNAKAMDTIKKLQEKLAATPGINIEQVFSLRVAIAQAWYDLAKVSFQVVAYLEPSLTAFLTGNSFKTFGGSGMDPIAFQTALFYYKIIYGYFSGSIVQARYYYYTVIQNDIAQYKGGKKQLQVLQKLVDLYRISAILPTRSQGMNEYKLFLQRISDYSEGRNPFLNRMIKQEMVFLTDPAEWLNRFPNLKRLNTILAEKLPPIFAYISQKTKASVVDFGKP